MDALNRRKLNTIDLLKKQKEKKKRKLDDLQYSKYKVSGSTVNIFNHLTNDEMSYCCRTEVNAKKKMKEYVKKLLFDHYMGALRDELGLSINCFEQYANHDATTMREERARYLSSSSASNNNSNNSNKKNKNDVEYFKLSLNNFSLSEKKFSHYSQHTGVMLRENDKHELNDKYKWYLRASQRALSNITCKGPHRLQDAFSQLSQIVPSTPTIGGGGGECPGSMTTSTTTTETSTITGHPKNKNKNRKSMTAKERKQKKLFDLPKGSHFIKYNNFIHLHELWKQYLNDLLSPNCDTTVSEVLLKADYHGAILKVVQSKCPSYVGTEGIAIQETENSFRIITKDDELKCVLKQGTIFTFSLQLPHKSLTVTLYGDNLRFRSYERSAKKFKKRSTIQLG